MKNDTIVAVATPRGVGGIAVIRLSGPDAPSIAESHLQAPNSVVCRRLGRQLRAPWCAVGSADNSHLSPRHATYCRFDDIDDGIAVYYPAGYTGEPTVEFSCHGSLYVQQAIVQALIDSGARMAEPGEFTMRAFLNGRLDLSQAEAVADLIDATTPAQHRLAISQLRGGYAEELKTLRQQLLDLTSLLELELDFSQEDVEFADRTQLKRLVDNISLRINALRGTFRLGNALKRGIPTAIIGRPNAGKSSLLNALLADNRAIVSPIAGTTRDTIEETFNIDNITFRLIDTAGLHDTDDPLENLGIKRAIAAAVQADIILYVHDATHSFAEALADMQSLQDAGVKLAGKHLWIVNNKMDLPEAVDPTPGSGIAVSSKTGNGLDKLRQAMVKAVSGDIDWCAVSSADNETGVPSARLTTRRRDGETTSGGILLSNVRHYDALGRTDAALRHVAAGLVSGVPADLVAVDLRDALYHLGTITGEVSNNEVLGNIFSRFCIGK